MAIDVTRETLVTLAEASHRMPGRPAIRSMWRYVLTGVGGHKLETVKAGGRRFTSEEAIDRFIAKCTGGESEATKGSSRRAREREITRAERELEQDGF